MRTVYRLGAVLAVTAAAGALAGLAGAKQSYATGTSLLRVAFTSSRRGVGLFQTERSPTGGSGADRCDLYTRVTTNGGASFGASGATLAQTNCQSGAAFSSIRFAGAGDLLAYGPRLEVSHNQGKTWTTPALGGSVVGLTASGGILWALATRCRSGQGSCTLQLVASSNGGSTWRVPREQPPDLTVSSPIALAGAAGIATLLTATSKHGLVLALPKLASKSSGAAPALARVERGDPRTGHWSTTITACSSGGYNVELAASGGSVWLACASEPGAGSQPKSLSLSKNGGKTWRVTSPPCKSSANCHQKLPLGGYLNGLVATSSRTAFYVGYQSALTATRNGGVTWRADQAIGGEATGTLQVTFVNKRDGWTVTVGAGGHSALWRTANGGKTWSKA